ncbi:hypothetical protein D910_05405 [Dendroctonus ponderosae]|uniref:Uncharacterized protein n=1 Tax=Dendroctonus ponderosae TaxID=77166 RepID=U4UBN6_DENPD|nr:hypothetical protein D910_05405 [Dendroctonus ponderosae]
MNELEKQIESDDTGSDLAPVNILMRKRQMIETQMAVKARQVDELEKQTKHLETAAPDKDINEIKLKKSKVEERFQLIKQPLIGRQRLLEKKKEALQFRRDVEDELLWIAKKMPLATFTKYGNKLSQVNTLQQNNQSQQTEVENHEPRVNTVCNNGQKNFMKKHESLEAAVEDYADTIRGLGETVKALSAEEHPLAEQVAVKQSQLGKLYAD